MNKSISLVLVLAQLVAINLSTAAEHKTPKMADDIVVSLCKVFSGSNEAQIKVTVRIPVQAGTGCWPALYAVKPLHGNDEIILLKEQAKTYAAGELVKKGFPHMESAVAGSMPGAGKTFYVFHFVAPQHELEQAGLRLIFNLYRTANPELTGGKEFVLCGESLTDLAREVRINVARNKVQAFVIDAYEEEPLVKKSSMKEACRLSIVRHS